MIHRHENLESWLASRAAGITATDAGAILGHNPWRTPAMVQAEKLGTAEQIEETAPMRWGHRLEPLILAEYAEAEKAVVAPNGLDVWTNDLYPLLRCTPDALVRHPAKGDGLLEAKSTRQPRWDAPPAGYLIQVQVQMAVTALDWCDLATLHAGSDLQIYPQIIDRDGIEQMYALLEAWWLRHVERGEPVPAEAADLTTLNRVAPVTGKRVLLPPDSRELIARWEAAKESRRLAEDVEKTCKARITQLLGDANEGVVPGLTKVVRRSKTLIAERIQPAFERTDLRLVKGGK